MTDAEALPRVSPFLIDRADTMCPRRLRRQYQRLKGDEGDFTRGRIRDPLVSGARAAHTDMGPPNRASFAVPDDLVPEEQAVLRQAIDHYLTLFAGDDLETVHDDAWDTPVRSDNGEFEVGGWIDLVGRRPDGAVELRQFELWGRRPVADPLESPTVLLACLRIRKQLRPDRIAIRHADLVRGAVADHDVDLAAAGGALAALFSRRLARIHARIANGEPIAGTGCSTCPYANGCPALRELAVR